MTVKESMFLGKQFVSSGCFVDINSTIFKMKKLSTQDISLSLKLVEQLKSKLQKKDFNEELFEILCENAVLGYMSLYQKGERAFLSPMEVLREFSTQQIGEIYSNYVSFQECYRVYKGYE